MSSPKDEKEQPASRPSIPSGDHEQVRAAFENAELERRRLAAVLEALPAGVAIADATGKVTHFNQALLRIWGGPPVPGNVEGYDEWRAVWSDTGEVLAPEDWAMARAIRTGELVPGDVIEIERFDGSGRATIINAAAPIKDAEGRVVGGVVAEVDITAQKLAERALVESEERYRAVVENTTAIILRVDPDGIIRFANQRALDFFGYSKQELLGRPATGTIVPLQETGGRDLASLVAEIIRDPDRFHSNANENLRKNGERVWVEWTNAGIYDDRGVLTEFLAVGIDATDRRKAEEEIRAQWRLFETVVSQLPAAVNIVRASDLRILIANPAYQVIAPGKEMVGKTMEEVWPELPEIVPIFREVAATGHTYSAVDVPYRIRRSEDGPLEEGFFSWSVSRIALPGNDGWGLLNTAWETTPRKRTEQALAAANARLTEADRRKDEFLAMLSHELRNPLATIGAALQLMGTADVDESVLLKARAAAVRQSAHMTRLVDELLDVSRITEGKVTLAREELYLRNLVEEAVDAARPAIEGRGQRVFLSVAREPIPILGDPVRLSQALGNLLSNAAKYTPANGEIRVIVERQGDQGAVVVRDTGIGIASELLPQIFDLFVQGERGPDRSQGGLGVGLTLARRLVEMHGGRIEAQSDGPGRGSQFTVLLPLLTRAHEEVAGRQKRQWVAVPARRRILVVDDNRDGAEMLTLQLQMEGHEAVAVHSGLDALAVAASYQPDIAFLDIGMPGMDGYELARRLRSDGVLARTILVALTGYGQEEDIERSRAAGFDYHLVKPADMDGLRRVIAVAGA